MSRNPHDILWEELPHYGHIDIFYHKTGKPNQNQYMAVDQFLETITEVMTCQTVNSPYVMQLWKCKSTLIYGQEMYCRITTHFEPDLDHGEYWANANISSNESILDLPQNERLDLRNRKQRRNNPIV